MGAGHQQGPVAASDKTACIPQDILAYGKLAREILILAAKDARTRSRSVSKSERVDAKKFFYSSLPEYVHHRVLWFGMAGIPLPPEGHVEECIEFLCRGCKEPK